MSFQPTANRRKQMSYGDTEYKHPREVCSSEANANMRNICVKKEAIVVVSSLLFPKSAAGKSKSELSFASHGCYSPDRNQTSEMEGRDMLITQTLQRQLHPQLAEIW
uniref:Uncharacterized protein n=1 Tax=Glossina pallidipes TaxID=7398 RepID=A0A1B0A3Y7_GLOPL